MKRISIFTLSSVFLAAGCGVKGAPMPRRDEVFIEKTLIKNEEESSKKDKAKDKMTILRKKDPR